MSRLLAIDPGNEYSGYVIVDTETYKPLEWGKVSNSEMLETIYSHGRSYGQMAIEMIGHYGTGMPAGKTVFDTCIWIGRFTQYYLMAHYEKPLYVLRATIKNHICGQSKAKDGHVVQALKDRFGEKGTKANQGFFFGFKADCWQAYALAVYWIDKMKEGA